MSSEQSSTPNDDLNPEPQEAREVEHQAELAAEHEAVFGSEAREAENHALKKRANLALLKYGLARLALFVVLTAVIQTAAYLIDSPVPLMISALLALLVAFPLSMLLFSGLRVNANASVAAWQERRQEEKEWVREELAKR
ncbi:DUF4229 domain-containing protein [Corynebacterium spheniscorum]|uniref:DUF4229 domain-containing protein n=1 Tax=Corynebacterium spheniscorum TaxID=185761 RepID=UPI000B85A6D4|nr:DUF4229 domain-containing protein [Corynebacterium spheniscorum]KAA8723731.1 DUF4229 domain-containing protein [Corynebacterium spheniscorum]